MGINPDENKRWWSLRTFPKKSSVCFLCNLLFPPRGVSSVLLIRRYCVSCKKRRYSCLPQVPLAKCVLPVGHAISVKKNVNCETGEWSHKAKEPGEMGETARIQKLLQTLISDQTVQHNNLFLRLHICIKHTMYLETTYMFKTHNVSGNWWTLLFMFTPKWSKKLQFLNPYKSSSQLVPSRNCSFWRNWWSMQPWLGSRTY